MRTRLGSIFASLALITTVLGLTAPPTAAAPAIGSRAAADRPELQQALDAITEAGAASGVLAGVKDERGSWAGGSGVADLRTGRPVPTAGRFRIGSVTKTFVATVLLQLVGEGRLRLTDPVERWLPGLVPNGEAITVRHLLNHTSGIFNYTDDTEALPLEGEEFLRKVRFRTFTPRELVGIATRHDPVFAPGTSWSYSNTGYIVAGLIIEKVTGRRYGEEVEHRIIRPLRLSGTSVPGTSVRIPGPHSHGYIGVEVDGELRPYDISRLNPSVAGAAGEMISTTEDLNRFFAALLSGRLLRPAELAAMKTTVTVESGFGYGLGIYVAQLPCGSVWGHDGGIPGYLTVSLHSEDGRRLLTASANPLSEAILDGLNNLILTEHCGSADVETRSPSKKRPLPVTGGDEVLAPVSRR